MGDITLCVNQECPLKDSCKRNVQNYKKRENRAQSYALFYPNEDSTCDHYMHYYNDQFD